MKVFLRLAVTTVLGLSAAGVALAASPDPVALEAVEGAEDSQAYAPYYAAGSDELASDETTAGTPCEKLLDCMGCCCPTWYVSAGAIVLHRNRPDPGTIVAANPAGTRFASPSDFNFGWNWGPDITVARRMATGNIWEGRFFSSVGSSATNSFVAPGNFIGVGFTGPGGTVFNGNYFTRLYSTELNWKRPIGDQLKFIAGFREIELRDQMSYTLNNNVATGQYNYNNHLWGGQLGADWALLNTSRRLQVNVAGKAGLYGNLSDGGIYEFSGNNAIGSFTGRKWANAFVGDLGISGAYFLTQHVALRGGYQLLWISDVALAGDAASRSLTNPSLLRTVDHSGQLFYQGATMAVDVIW
jgi:hypothetical protein